MSTIKKLPRKHWNRFVEIVVNAYPGFGAVSVEDIQRIKQRLLRAERYRYINCYGLYRYNTLVGGMRLFDFVMNVFNNRIRAGGVGLIAVDLVHKKEKVCKEMVEFFINHYRGRGYSLATLYPFRPDFYKKMGFGYGATIQQYAIKPAALPRGASKAHIRFLRKKDLPAIKACFKRFCSTRHGMIFNTDYMFDPMFDGQAVKCIGFVQKKQIRGFLTFSFRTDPHQHWLKNDILIHDFIWETPDAFEELITFLHTQLDQIRRIIYGTQEEQLHWVPYDPRCGGDNLLRPLGHETNAQGVGIMYKVINVARLFRELRTHNFGNQTCTVRFDITDDFTPENGGAVNVAFKHGVARVVRTSRHDVTVTIDIALFSSCIMGAVSFRLLYRYGLVGISKKAFVDTVDALFLCEEKPVCTAQF